MIFSHSLSSFRLKMPLRITFDSIVTRTAENRAIEVIEKSNSYQESWCVGTYFDSLSVFDYRK